MGVRELACDPDDNPSVEARGVGQQLAEMKVVRPLQLIFDQDEMVGIDDLGDDIGGEAVDGMLGSNQLEAWQIQTFGEKLKIVGSR
jgi:hypothetical protein